MGIANAFYSSVYIEFVILQYLWKPQSKMLILLVLLFLFFFLLFSVQSAGFGGFFSFFFVFLMPVYNVKLFLQPVSVIILKYFFSSLKITKQNRKPKR